MPRKSIDEPSFTLFASDTLTVSYVRDWANAGMRRLTMIMQQTGKSYTPADMQPFLDAFALANQMEAWRLVNPTLAA